MDLLFLFNFYYMLAASSLMDIPSIRYIKILTKTMNRIILEVGLIHDAKLTLCTCVHIKLRKIHGEASTRYVPCMWCLSGKGKKRGRKEKEKEAEKRAKTESLQNIQDTAFRFMNFSSSQVLARSELFWVSFLVGCIVVLVHLGLLLHLVQHFCKTVRNRSFRPSKSRL